MSKYILIAFAVAALLIAYCGSTTSVGSSVSIGITTPNTSTEVSVTSTMVVTITDTDNVGITVPSSWSSVFSLKVVGSDINLCTNSNIIYDSTAKTITCTPETLADMTQYALSISGLTDAAGTRIDPASLAFQTGPI